MSDSVTDALQRLLEIGGMIIIFSVMVRISGELGITDMIIQVLRPLFTPLELPEGAYLPLLTGWLELHIGAYALAASALPKQWIVSSLCAMLAWGGLAAHLQVKAIIQKAGIRYTPFFLARSLQALIAFGLAFLLWMPFHEFLSY